MKEKGKKEEGWNFCLLILIVLHHNHVTNNVTCPFPHSLIEFFDPLEKY
jgi:hypothetical protein